MAPRASTKLAFGGGPASALRVLHNAVGVGELACLGYVWVCAITRRRDRWLGLSMAVLTGEGAGLVLAKGCPLGMLQRRTGDDVPMFELWFGPRLAPYAIPAFTVLAVLGGVVVVMRQPDDDGVANAGQIH